MKRITQEPWFGKKLVGYGPAPKTWQGWIVTLLFVLTVILDFIYFQISIITILIFIVALVRFFCNRQFNRGKPGMDRKRGNPIISLIYVIILVALIIILDTMTFLNQDFIARLIVNILIVIVFGVVYLVFIRNYRNFLKKVD